jgi:cholesterol oxidase
LSRPDSDGAAEARKEAGGAVVTLVSGELPENDVDDLVVGSGFGGSVTAYRLAEAGRRVCVLERGKAYPPGSFPRSPTGIAGNFWDPSAGLHGMFDLWSFAGIDAVVSSGLGGGSLIYANVLLRKDPSWFRQHRPYDEGDEDWPVSYSDLEPHYERVERFLDVQTMPYGTDGFAVPKTDALREAAFGAGAEWRLAPLGVRFRGPDGSPVLAGPLAPTDYGNIHGLPRRTCRLCGECDLGCNDGAKNTLDHTYLSAASALGAAISVRSEVRGLRRLPDGRFAVDYVVHAAEAEGTAVDSAALPVRTVRASRVFLAAGALGSTYLLLRSRTALGLRSPALGTRFCGNGDLLGFIFGAARNGTPRRLDGSVGPVITSYLRYPDWTDTGAAADLGMYIEDAGYPAFVEWLAEATQAGALVRRAARATGRRVLAALTGRTHTNLSAELARVIGPGQLSSAALPLLGMGRDVPDGTLYLRDPAAALPQLESTWTTATSDRYFAVMCDRMRGLAAALQGRFAVNPTYLLRRVITVHPVGGCPMATHPDAGVVDAYGRVHGVPGLFVCDGSVLPGPVGPNPSLTIAAFADRLCDALA